MNVEQFQLDGPWLEAFRNIRTMMETGSVDPRWTELDKGPTSDQGVEKYARQVVESNGRMDLGIIHGLASVATCVATQGGIVIDCPIVGGGWLKVPAIQHMIGVAPSGWRKSTAIGTVQKPLDHAMRLAEKQRRERLRTLLADAKQEWENAVMAMPDAPPRDDAQFSQIYLGGLCPTTVVKDPTTEALRNLSVHNGGVVGVISGEADVFRNIKAYAPDGGSLTFFLDLWDQGTISTARVGGGVMSMHEAALLMGVLFQTDVFAEVTSGSDGRGGIGADSFLSRGIFGRMWVVEVAQVGGFADIAALYGDNTVHDQDGEDGDEIGPGELTALGYARLEFENMLAGLAEQTNEYRMRKALNQSWRELTSKRGVDIQVPEIEPIERQALRLSPAAQKEYNRVQRLYLALEQSLQEMDEDATVMWGPLCSRLVQHVMREALVVTLSSGSRDVTAEIIRDCATRVVPWRWAMTTKALGRRALERAEDVLAHAALDNSRGVDRTPRGRVKAAMAQMWRDASDEERKVGWAKTQITAKVTGMLPRNNRKNVAKLVESALEELCSDSTSGVLYEKIGTNPVNRQPVMRYTIAEWCVFTGT